MVLRLVHWKEYGSPAVRIGAGIALYILNQFLILDFAISSLCGVDPRLSVSALIGIRLYRDKSHPIFSRLPAAVKSHCLKSAYWWDYEYPPINRSIWK